MLNIPEIPQPHPAFQAKGAATRFLDEYTVTLNGRPARVRRCRESALPFNREWDGTQRSADQSEVCGFVSFAADEPVTVAVTGDFPADKAILRPLSRGIAPASKGAGKLEFTLEAPGYHVLELGSIHNTLYLLFEEPYAAPPEASIRWYFGPGIHFPGKINLQSGDMVYLDPAAIVFGRIFGKDVHDVTIFGGGTLHGGADERIVRDFHEDIQGSSLKFYNSTDIRISNVIVQDSPCWTTSFFGCSRVHIDHLKILGQWRYNTDGIDLVNTDHVEITDSLVHSFDDGIVLKGYDIVDFTTVPWTKGRSVTDISVQNCILWCGWGRTLEIGFETGAPEFTRIRFENCDLIHNSAVCLDIRTGNYGTVHDVAFRNIRIEYQADTLPEVFQKAPGQIYRPEDSWQFQKIGNPGGPGTTAIGVPTLIFAGNYQFTTFGRSEDFGSIYDIRYEDIAVLAEPGVPSRLPVKIANLSDDARFSDFTIRNLTVNGRRVTRPEDMDFDTTGNVSNIVWE